jgi:hypothetical protein
MEKRHTNAKVRKSRRPRVVKNVWPFGEGQLLGPRTTVRHVRSGVKKTSNARYKGYMIFRRADGDFEVPSIDRESRFDTKRDAQRFIDAEVKYARNPGSVTPAMLSQYASLFPGGSITPAILKKVGREYARVTNPGTGAFKRCVEAVAASGTAASPSGVCAAAARRKYGAKKLAKMAAAGKGKAKSNPRSRGNKTPKGVLENRKVRRSMKSAGARSTTKARYYAQASANRLHRRKYPQVGPHVANPKKRAKNPIDQAADTYENFHGRAADEVIEVTETVHEHSVLSGIGELVKLTIAAVDGVSVVDISGFKGALLAQNEQATQLFIVGGDQSVNLSDFGIVGKPHECEVLGAATEVAYKTRKDHLGKAGGAGERAIHVHDFGSLRQVDPKDPRSRQGSRLPIVTYDTRNERLVFAGGGYDLPEVGIRG